MSESQSLVLYESLIVVGRSLIIKSFTNLRFKFFSTFRYKNSFLSPNLGIPENSSVNSFIRSEYLAFLEL